MLFSKKKDLAPAITLFNTRSKEKEVFKPITAGKVKMYSCGPTVYDYVHIGNLRSFVFSDVVRRVFEHAGYSVTQVMNITDFGHLVGDADDTEDKMTVALKREGKALTMENMLTLADTYIDAFKSDLHEMNILTPHKLPRASDHVRGMMAYIEVLLEKSYAYTTASGIYFDTEQFGRYGALGGSASDTHSRIGASDEKKNSADFALWKFDEQLGWDAPWGKGFPGWHIECTAMSTHYLGKTFDIHTGGIDHIPIHHNNEIAQAEAANNRPLAHYWLHNEFVTLGDARIGKSQGNAITLKQVVDKGISPLAYRYWLFTGHYRQNMKFTWEAVEAAHTALTRAWRLYTDLPVGGEVQQAYQRQFNTALYDDLNTAEGVATLWELLKDDTVAAQDKRATIDYIDTVLGIGFASARARIEKTKVAVLQENEIPSAVQEMIDEREAARNVKDFAKADSLREEIKKAGFEVHDSPEGPVINRV